MQKKIFLLFLSFIFCVLQTNAMPEKETIEKLKSNGYAIVEHIYNINDINNSSNDIIIQKNNKFGVYDCSQEKFVIPVKYDNLEFSAPYTSPLYIVTIGDKKGAYTKLNDKYILSIPIEYDKIERLPHPQIYHISVTKNDKKGLYIIYDYDSDIIKLPADYEDIKMMTDAFVAVKKNGKYGAYQFGKQVVPIQYDNISSVNDYFIVTSNNKQGIYHNEKIVIPIEYEEIKNAFDVQYSVQDGYGKFIVKKSGLYGVYGLFPPEYDSVEPVYRGFIIKKNGKYGLYHLTRGMLLNPEYDKIYMSGSKYAPVQSFAVCEKNGRIINNIDMSLKSTKEKTDDAVFNTIFSPITIPMKGVH